ncbi:hypothetical protein ABEV74_15335 [Paenibacillus cisolokensis]|jgi:hypothetical protein|uniref:Copper amine oxidase-like N-terminal domain-containing protein n=1 Tax=Paenibacillus cisolokensis TaxID=1658519 RepID=A0ABQ4ND35_9BACL|nr:MULTISPECIES: hypothetical protein [Paenibacillus]ALS28367.1 hypothetical protein IJ21_29710 [Paenibacillus sp. 32O-W]GIQ66147.1 hypothetical protein PACILC2_47150 [Paenibacillus cisolokensis]
MKKTTISLVVAVACLFTVGLALAENNEYEPVPRTADTITVFIDHIRSADGGYAVTFDQVDWYEGEEANAVFRERENDPEVTEAPDGYYIVNDDETMRTLKLDANAVVLLQLYNRTGDPTEAEIVWNEKVPAERFVELIEANDGFGMKDFPYHLTVKNGVIVKVVQQFIP